MLTGLARRAHAVRHDDEGVTLMELVVAMTISSILGALTLALFVTVNNSSAATTDRSIGAAQARNILQSWSSYLRVSDGPVAGSSTRRFEWLRPTGTIFYADLNNRSGSGAATPPTMIWLRLDQANHDLVEEQFTLPAGYPTTPLTYPAKPAVCRVLARHSTALTITGYTGGGTVTSNGSLSQPWSDAAGQPCQNLTTAPTADATLNGITSVGLGFTITATDGTRPQQYAAVVTVPQLGP